MNIPLTWNPAGGPNSLSQEVQYRKAGVVEWTTAATIGAAINSYTINNLDDNQIYEFRIVNNCSFGGPAPSNIFSKINFICPSVGITPTYEKADLSVELLGKSVTSYKIDLLSVGGSLIATSTYTDPVAAVTHTFSGLNPVTTYKIQVTLTAGTFTKSCDPVEFTTSALPTCSIPTGLTATLA